MSTILSEPTLFTYDSWTLESHGEEKKRNPFEQKFLMNGIRLYGPSVCESIPASKILGHLNTPVMFKSHQPMGLDELSYPFSMTVES